jgi:hypothetical protein
MLTALLLYCAVLAFSSVPAGAQSNLLANGSFQEPRVSSTLDYLFLSPPPLPGWQIDGGSVALVPYTTWQPAEGQGRQSLLLGGPAGPGSIEQSFPTQPGQYYLVSGWLAHDTSDPSQREGRAQLFLNSQPFTALVHSDARATGDNMRWTLFASRFRAVTDPTILKLTGSGAVLDGVAVTLTGSAAPVGAYFPIDLSQQINYRLFDSQLNSVGSNLQNLGDSLTPDSPLKILRGVPFLLDGVILVGPGTMEGRLTQGPVTMPRQVNGIPVGLKLKHLFFLHGTEFNLPKQGMKIGAYVIHYADGSSVSIPIRYGVDLADWWTYPTSRATAGPVVWQGISESARRWDRNTGFKKAVGRPLGLQLFLKTWDNPTPDLTIQSLDLVTGDQNSTTSASAPFVVAVTGS